MDDQLKAKLLKLFPASIVEAAVLYVPAVNRLGLKEFQDFVAYVRHKNSVEARKLIRSKMTRAELAKEAKEISQLMKQIAEEQHEAVQLGKAITLSIFKAALLAAVGL